MFCRMKCVMYRRAFISIIALACLVGISTGFAAQPDAAGANFDIPTSELNKVKKKAPAKSESKKKKKHSSKSSGENSQKNAKNEHTGQAAAITPTPHTAENVVSIPAEQLDSGDIQIHHAPYSFIVAGKPTVIHVVINSKSEIQKLSCALRGEGDSQAQIIMEKVKGTQFTYTATLPAVTAQDTALRYMIVSVDAQGKMSRSKEYSIPVTDSPVVPSWQVDSQEKPAEGK